MLFDAGLTKPFWAEACNYAAYLMNRIPRVLLNNKTPDEMWFGDKPDVSTLRVFGSPIMVHVSDKKRDKWSPKSERMVFLGHDNLKKGCRCYSYDSKKVIVSRDVKFFETFSSSVLIDQTDENRVGPADIVKDDVNFEATDKNEMENSSNESSNDPDDAGESDAHSESAENTSAESANDTIVAAEDIMHDDTVSSPDDLNDANFNTRARIDTPTVQRTSSRIRVPTRPFQVTHLALISLEPQTVHEALSGDEKAQWKKAMCEEMDAHRKNNTWTLANLPSKKNIVKTK